VVIAFVFLFCVFPFVFVKGAAAQTSTYVLNVPTLQSDSEGKLGTIYISEASYPMSLKKGDALSINLPRCIEMESINIEETTAVKQKAAVSIDKGNRQFTVNGSVYGYGSIGSVGFSVQITENNRFNIIIDKDSTSLLYYKFYISLDKVKVMPLSSDDPPAITATLDTSPGSGFSTGTYTVANTAVGGTTASVDAPLSTGQDQTPIVPILGADGGKVATIIIKESAPGSMKTGIGDIKLAMGTGFAWKDVSVVSDWGYGPTDVSYAIDNDTDTGGRSVVKLSINNATTDNPGRITVTGSVDVDESLAQHGDIQVSFEGTNPGVDVAVLTVAEYAASTKTAEQETTSDVTAGCINQRVGQFSIQEGTPGDFAEGRTIRIKLPSCAKWNTAPTVVREKGDAELQFIDINQEKDELRYTVKKSSTVKSNFVFKYGIVDLALGAPETLSVELLGTAGLSGFVDIANIMQPISLQSEIGSISLGQTGQNINDITITEYKNGVLRAKDATANQAKLTLQMPSGVRFAEVPYVEVIEGDLVLDKVGINGDSDRLLEIPIQRSGTVPSTIKISGIKLDVDRTIPEGDIKLEVGGTSISETSNVFSGSDNYMYMVVASCATSALTASSSEAVFKINQPSYTVNGQDVLMDVAPYINSGRTMIPLRFAANAVGVTDGNISWNEGTKTVTLIKNSRVVQMKIGSNDMQINGITIVNDVAPEINNGRTMVPIRALSTALGAVVQWNETDQTVTVSCS
jgi:hypothetical protein